MDEFYMPENQLNDSFDEFYIPEEQIVTSDIAFIKFFHDKKLIAKSLVKEFSIAELDKIKNLDEFLKIEIAYAIGCLFGSGRYMGMNSGDSTWLYDFNEKDCNYGGVAIVRENKVVDFYQIWQKLNQNGELL